MGVEVGRANSLVYTLCDYSISVRVYWGVVHCRTTTRALIGEHIRLVLLSTVLVGLGGGTITLISLPCH